MNLTGIIAISGRPGLYKVVAQGKNNIIVEALEDQKRFPAYASDRISALEDISIYTYEEDKPLREIYSDIYKKENGGACISHKEEPAKLQAYLMEILPDFDQERVYNSDIKKLFQWYNLLHAAGLLEAAAEEEENGQSGEEASETNEEEATEKKTTAKKSSDTKSEVKKETKKPAAKKAAGTAKPKADTKSAKTAAPKSAAAKKPAVKGGTSRGK